MARKEGDFNPDVKPHPLQMTMMRAAMVGQQVALHLESGHVEAARQAIDLAWVAHLKECEELSPEDLLRLPIASMSFSVLIVNTLEAMGVLYFHQLLQLKREQLVAWPNMGEVRADEIISQARLWVDKYHAAVARQREPELPSGGSTRYA